MSNEESQADQDREKALMHAAETMSIGSSGKTENQLEAAPLSGNLSAEGNAVLKRFGSKNGAMLPAYVMMAEALDNDSKKTALCAYRDAVKRSGIQKEPATSGRRSVFGDARRDFVIAHQIPKLTFVTKLPQNV